MITIVTSHGDIVVELFEESAPISSENFKKYIANGFYAETVFHRVIPNFMIQGGGLTADMNKKSQTRPSRTRRRTVSKTFAARSLWPAQAKSTALPLSFSST